MNNNDYNNNDNDYNKNMNNVMKWRILKLYVYIYIEQVMSEVVLDSKRMPKSYLLIQQLV